MSTVFIVDDEALTRDGLKQIIDWEALGFTVCGEASNGEDAEKEILEKQPDLYPDGYPNAPEAGA